MTKHDAVQLRSYFLWEGDGKPDGHELEYWLRAEAELAKEQTAASQRQTQSQGSILTEAGNDGLLALQSHEAGSRWRHGSGSGAIPSTDFTARGCRTCALHQFWTL